MAKMDRKMAKQLRAAGWHLHSNKNHEKWRCSCGVHQMTKASTMGGGRAAKNVRSFMRKQGACSVDLKLG